MKLYQPSECRPVQVCAECLHPWPCQREQTRIEAKRRAAEAVKTATEAALLMKTISIRGEDR